MMKKLLLYINRKPKSVRDNYALGIASTFTALVLFIWVVAQSGDYLSSTGESVTEENSTSPFSTLISETKQKLSQVKDSIKASEAEVSQTAAVSEASGSNPSGIILDAENLESVLQNYEKSVEEDKNIENTAYTEVMIATTSVSTNSSTTSTTTAQ